MAFSVMATFYSLSPRRQDAKNATHQSGHKIESMASIPELLDGHVTLGVECLDRLYLNGYIGPLATSGGLVKFIREQLGKTVPWAAFRGIPRVQLGIRLADGAVPMDES